MTNYLVNGKFTKLEEDLKKKLEDSLYAETELTEVEKELTVKALAEVCKGYIERAFMANEPAEYCGQDEFRISYENWLKSEGITE